MAIDFYKLGRKTGATTPKGQQSGFQSLVGSAIKPIEDMLKASQEKTAALTASMTAGVPIDKVPEELRGQVTNFLTENKKSYTDATKVIASGVNPQSEQYKNAVETINNVNGRFENLSANLENIALERQKYLDDPSYSPNTSRSDATTMSDLANGSLYGKMSLNEDGSWNYTDAKGESKAFRDFKVNKQGYLGQQGFIAMTEHLDKNALDINGNVKKWEGGLENYYGLQLNQLFNKLGPKGSQDYVMADDKFLQTLYDNKKLDGTKGSFEDYKDALTQGSKEEVVEEYKQYNLNLLKEQHGGAVAKQGELNNPPNKTNKYGGFAYASDTGGDSTAGTSAFTNISYSDKVARRKSLLNLETIPGAHYTYKYDKNDEGGWAAYDGTAKVRNMDGAEVARIEGLMSMNDSSFSDFNQQKVKSDLDNKNLKAKTPGTVGLGLINIEGNTIKNQVNKVANNLYEIFDNNFKNDFNISVVSKNTTGGSGMFSSSSGISKTPNKIKITSKDGGFEKVYDIGPNATQETVDQINKDFADYIIDPLKP